MNPKINKVNGEIEKTKEKIAEQQTRLRELERQKTEFENADIVSMVRGLTADVGDFEEFVRAFKEQQRGKAVPDNYRQPSRTETLLTDENTATDKEDSDEE